MDEKKLAGKKLRLNKETIRNLSDESLEQVAGGGRKTSIDVLSGCNSCVCSVVCGNDSLVICSNAIKC